MEDIKVGEYVRMKSLHGIAKVTDVYDYDIETENLILSKSDVLSHSENLIDLIEVGDYVNGYKVKDIRLWNTFFNGKHEYKLDFGELGTMKSGEIRSIVTHEQFECMKFVVGDK